ncbi:hypothetical protein SDRG_17105 [Saprolegnia diclina VS20]|uniref:Uncharacterized protein n=1 Tax=Saprolegnia diclina (strain VS20) TaxID=1156394 RepID=T0PI28_SAPDV|nr:hypothetical protein SDRG_17105 [Saprolegnia diclina VS20]EQC25004.1 hypothetical protein SDRG_17105 [Saprolegnia diclina VS20]|eukprot:XP_008621562.1 hypothetical protein SDRG_17105 [Saprolegnia diclina VS20]
MMPPVRSRKITVNERIDHILDGSCRETICLPEDDATMLQRSRDSKRISDLYNVSFEDKFLKQRMTYLPSPIAKDRHELRSRLRLSREGYNCYSSSASAPSLLATPPVVVVSPIKETAQANVTPWYVGRNNVPDVPTCDLAAKTKRYGARGTIQLLAQETTAGTVPPLTTTKYNAPSPLKVLGKFHTENAFAPKLTGSPAMWPEDAAFVTGPKLAFHNTHLATSSGVSPKKSVLTEPVLADEHLKRVDRATEKQVDVLKAALELEQEQGQEQLRLGRENLQKMLRKKQRELRRHPNVHHDKVPAKALREITLIKSLGPPRIAPIETKLVQSKYQLRWKTIFFLIDSIRRSVFNRPMLQELALLLDKITEWGVRHAVANPFEMTRDQCRELFMKEYPSFGVPNFNLMYSSFDPTHTDVVDMRDIIGTVKALRITNSNSTGSTMKDIVLDLIAMYANEGVVPARIIEKVLTMYCGSIDDETKVHDELTALYELHYRSFRSPKALVPLHEVLSFLSDQPSLIEMFTDFLRYRRRHMNSYTINGTSNEMKDQ